MSSQIATQVKSLAHVETHNTVREAGCRERTGSLEAWENRKDLSGRRSPGSKKPNGVTNMLNSIESYLLTLTLHFSIDTLPTSSGSGENQAQMEKHFAKVTPRCHQWVS